MARGEHLRTLKKVVGVVVSTNMDRTAVVVVPRLKVHAKTRRVYKHITRYFCHDEHEVCGVGDKVQLKYVGQLSKKKHWAVIDILARFPQLEGEPFPMSRLRFDPYKVLTSKQAASHAATAAATTASTSATTTAAPVDAAPLR